MSSLCYYPEIYYPEICYDDLPKPDRTRIITGPSWLKNGDGSPVKAHQVWLVLAQRAQYDMDNKIYRAELAAQWHDEAKSCGTWNKLLRKWRSKHG